MMKIKKICKNHNIRYLFLPLNIFMSVLWQYYFQDTDSYFVIYQIVSLVSFLSTVYIVKYSPVLYVKNEKKVVNIIAFFLSAANLLANFASFEYANPILILMLLIVGFVIYYVILFVIVDILSHKTKFIKETNFNNKRLYIKLFILSFLFMTTVYLIYFIFVSRPGILTYDSYVQQAQIVSGNYTNHHPFWHTIIIAFFIKLGMILFHDISYGTALFVIFQIIFMSVCFSYITINIYRISCSKTMYVLSVLFFSLMPYNISYSSTVWKDIPFAICVAVFITIFYNIAFRNENTIINKIMLFLFGMGFCLMRNNGWLAFGIAFIIFLILFLFGKNTSSKSTVGIFVIILFISWFMKNPLLDFMEVKEGKFTEALSIPIQQISRVVYEGKELEDDEILLIEKVISVETIKKIYISYISDPVKGTIADSGSKYIENHKYKYLKLWLKIGKRYPVEYLKAWIEQTKGYWNGGYDYWIVGHNTAAIHRDNFVSKVYLYYFGLFEKSFMVITSSVGVLNTFYVFCFMYFWSKKRKEKILIIPLFAIVLTLLIATPVFCEFRYAYSLFTCFPFIFTLLLYPKEENLKISKNIAEGKNADGI